MSTVTIANRRCRTQPLLHAIGAQEALEAQGRRMASLQTNPHVARLNERDRMALAKRRNAAEARLRPDEHEVWDAFRRSTPAGRETIRAILTDVQP